MTDQQFLKLIKVIHKYEPEHVEFPEVVGEDLKITCKWYLFTVSKNGAVLQTNVARTF